MIIPGKENSSAKDSTLHIVQGHSQQVTVGMARIDEPPPYFEGIAENRSPVRPEFPAPVLSSSSTPDGHGKNADNHLYAKTRHEPIEGAFNINPDLDTVALDKTGATTIDRRAYNQKRQQRHRHHCRKGLFKRVELPIPNAIFETRQGRIVLDLAVVADGQQSHSRALVQVASRQGFVDINVRDIHAHRNLNLEVSTRNGNVHIMIPRSFSGYIQLYSRHGDFVFLPNLTNAMHLVSRREHESQVIVGNASNHFPEKGAPWMGDMIHVSSRSGNIFVGYIDEDQAPNEEPGFWQKLMDVFQEMRVEKGLGNDQLQRRFLEWSSKQKRLGHEQPAAQVSRVD